MEETLKLVPEIRRELGEREFLSTPQLFPHASFLSLQILQ
jgi:hypothetical protein